jgi:di/tripeptidase
MDMDEQAALLLLRGLYQAKKETFTALCHAKLRFSSTPAEIKKLTREYKKAENALLEARQDFPGIDFWS